MGRKRVGLLFGGRSGEHEISLRSARGILAALDPRRHEVVLLAVDRDGRWLAGEAAAAFLGVDPSPILARDADARAALAMFDPTRGVRREGAPLDVVLPIIHGTTGEDGSLQGLLRLLEIPFVGASVLASAACMDKDLSKRVLREAGIPVARHVALRRDAGEPVTFDDAVSALGCPLFVKPANLGSSVGIAKAGSAEEFDAALEDAFRYDRKIVVEEFVAGREIECAVLGNEDPVASVPGEIRPRHAFYDYEAKYLDPNGADLLVPADLDDEVALRVRETALRAFLALDCDGMARVDFFLRPDGTPVVNELNTLPGFTSISMYPKLFEASGISFPELLDRLLALAETRYRSEVRLERSYRPTPSDPVTP